MAPRCDLYLGDCLNILPNFAPRSVHFVLTDPPFGVTECSWDRRPDLAAWWEQIERVATIGAVIAVFCTQPFTTALINSRPKLFRYDLVWDKINAVGHLNANRQPMRQHEQVLIFCRRPSESVYVPQKLPGKPYRSIRKAGSTGSVYSPAGAFENINTGDRHPTSILRHAKPRRPDRMHPTEKPTTLLNWLVRSYSRPCQKVLDTYFGSCSTGEASTLAGRSFVGMERDPTIFSTGLARMQRHVGPARLTVHK